MTAALYIAGYLLAVALVGVGVGKFLKWLNRPLAADDPNWDGLS